MDRERALSELGLSVPVSSDALRRAYLRAVREHPPERDPEGFQRVRSAYELLLAAPWSWAADASGAEPPAQTDEPAERDSSDDAERETDEAAERETDDEAEPRDASDDGDSTLEPRYAAVADALKQNDVERAATAMLVLYGAADAAVPHPWLTVRTIAWLLERGRQRLARELGTAFEQRMKADGIGARELSSEFTARWALVRELLSLSNDNELELVSALAAALQSGSYETAHDALVGV